MQTPDLVLIAASPYRDNVSSAQSLVSGFASGIISRTVMCPFDVVKLILQTSQKSMDVKQIVSNIWKRDGISGFWRGNLAASINIGPQAALKFFVLDRLQRIFGYNGKLSGFQRALIGSTAGIISQTTVFPLDVIMTRITVHPNEYTSFFQATKKIITDEGAFGLWKGIAPTIVGAVIYEGSQFLVSDTIRQYFFAKNRNFEQLKPWEYLFIGAVSGAVSQTVSYPFDVVRKRMMISCSAEQIVHRSMGNCFKSIYQYEGLKGFFRGISINMIKIVPYTALQYTLNEEIRNLFKNFNSRKH